MLVSYCCLSGHSLSQVLSVLCTYITHIRTGQQVWDRFASAFKMTVELIQKTLKKDLPNSDTKTAIL